MATKSSAEPSKYIIYGLVDPVDMKLRYVGRSCSGLRRPKQHFEENRLLQEPEGHKTRWIRKLKARGLLPTVIVIQELSEIDILNQAEKFWIKYFKSLGFDLINKTEGGDSPVFFTKLTIAARKRLSYAHGMSPELEKEIIDLYQSGLTSRNVATRVNKNQKAVLNVLRRNNIVPRSHRQSRGVENAEEFDGVVINLYQTGLSTHKIALQLGKSQAGIWDILKRNSIKLRSQKEAQAFRRKNEQT